MSHEITACGAKSGSWWKAQGAGPTGGRGGLGERAAAPWRGGGGEEVSESPVEAEDSTSKGHQAPAFSDHDWGTDGLKEEEDEGLQDLMIANVKWRRPGLVVGFVSSAFLLLCSYEVHTWHVSITILEPTNQTLLWWNSVQWWSADCGLERLPASITFTVP